MALTEEEELELLELEEAEAKASQPPQPEAKEPRLGEKVSARLGAATSGLLEAGTAFQAPKLVGLTQAVLNPEDLPGGFSERYKGYKEAAEGAIEEEKARSPFYAGVGALAGSVPTAAAAPSVIGGVVSGTALSGLQAESQGAEGGEILTEAAKGGVIGAALPAAVSQPVRSAVKGATKFITTAPARIAGMTSEAIDTLIANPMKVIMSKIDKTKLGEELAAPARALQSKIANKQLTKDELALEVRNLQQKAQEVKTQAQTAQATSKRTLADQQLQEAEALKSTLAAQEQEAAQRVGAVKGALEESKLQRMETSQAARDALALRRDELKSVGVSDEAVNALETALKAQREKTSQLAQQQVAILRERGVDATVNTKPIMAQLKKVRDSLTLPGTRAADAGDQRLFIDPRGVESIPIGGAKKARISTEKSKPIDEFLSKYKNLDEELSLEDALKLKQDIQDMLDFGGPTGSYIGAGKGALNEARKVVDDAIMAKAEGFEDIKAALAQSSKLQSEASKLLGRGDSYSTLGKAAKGGSPKLNQVLSDLEASTGVRVTPHLEELSEANKLLSSQRLLKQTLPEVGEAAKAQQGYQAAQKAYSLETGKAAELAKKSREALSKQKLQASTASKGWEEVAQEEAKAARGAVAQELKQVRDAQFSVKRELADLSKQLGETPSDSTIEKFLTKSRDELAWNEVPVYDKLMANRPDIFEQIKLLRAKEELMMKGSRFGQMDTIRGVLKPLLPAAVGAGAITQRGISSVVDAAQMTPMKREAIQTLLRQSKEKKERK